MQLRGLIISILILCSIFFSKTGKAQKTDTIYHTNGNILTGDLRKLNYGVVTWKMQGMGTISLKTPDLQTIKATNSLR